MTPELIDLEIEYAAFNALKTVEDPRESRFAAHRSGDLWVTLDPHRPATYYNRVLGLTATRVPELPAALEALPGRECRVDVPVSELDGCDEALRSHGFGQTGSLLWLAHSGPGAEERTTDSSKDRTEQTITVDVRRLGADDSDRARVRDLLEVDRPIPPQVWEARKVHLCTDTFRAYGIETDGRLVAMATLFLGRTGAVIGNAFTMPEYRGRGYQRALLTTRIRDTQILGHGSALVDVEPGSASHRNCLRTGFRPIAEMAIYERDDCSK